MEAAMKPYHAFHVGVELDIFRWVVIDGEGYMEDYPMAIECFVEWPVGGMRSEMNVHIDYARTTNDVPLPNELRFTPDELYLIKEMAMDAAESEAENDL